MKTLKFLLKKEFLQVSRNKFLLAIIVLLPLFQLAILPWAATFEQKNISLAIVDNDRSTTSVKLRNKVISSGYFELVDAPANYSDALHSVEQGRSGIILEVPSGFEKDFVNNSPVNLMMSIDAVNGQKAALGMSYLSQIIVDFNREMIQEKGRTILSAIHVEPYFRFNKQMRYQNFMVPGILVILVTLMGGMLSALNIVREKEMGTIEQINVTPVPKSMFILAKLIPFWVIGLVNLSIGIFIAWLIYGLFPLGNILNIYVFAFFYLLAFTGFGLMISNFAKTQQQAMFMVMFFLIVFILLSGLFTPISSMPEWAQSITLFNPLRYFVEVIRLVYMKGSLFADILPQLYAIFGFVILFNFLAVISYRKTTK